MKVKSFNDLKQTTVPHYVTLPASDEIIYDDNDQPVILHVGGMFTKQYQNHLRKHYLQRENTEANQNTEKSIDEQMDELEQLQKDDDYLVAATVIDWEPREFWDDTGDGQFTVDKLAEALHQQPWLKAQLMEVLKDHKRFFRAHQKSTNGSSKTQSKPRVSRQQRTKSKQSSK